MQEVRGSGFSAREILGEWRANVNCQLAVDQDFKIKDFTHEGFPTV